MATSTTDATAIINNNTNQFPSSTILPPRLIISNKIDGGPCSGDEAVVECSVHTLPKPLVREFHHVFAEKYLETTTTTTTTSSSSSSALDLLAIPTNQKARMDLVNIGDHVEQEKDRLLNTVSFDFLCLHSRILATPFLLAFLASQKHFSFFFHSHFPFFLVAYSLLLHTYFILLSTFLPTNTRKHTLHTTFYNNQPNNQLTKQNKTKTSLSILPKIFVTNLGLKGIGQILSIRVLDCL